MKNPAFSKDEQSLKITVRSIEKFSLLNTCAVLFQNRQLLFGGTQEPTQIIELRRCSLVRVGTLKFDYDSQSCTGWFGKSPYFIETEISNQGPVGNNQIFLCFDKNSAKTCRVAQNFDFDFQTVPYSLYDHKHIRIAASPDYVLAAGSTNHIRSEVFNLKTSKWKRVRDFGNMKGSSEANFLTQKLLDQVSRYAVVYYLNRFYFFGGYHHTFFGSFSMINTYSVAEDKWTVFGAFRTDTTVRPNYYKVNLGQGRRHNHIAIVKNDTFHVYGGEMR